MAERQREAVRYLADLGEIRRRFGLERIRAVLDRLGAPERDLRCVHIAGTNGKGSTASLIAAALSAAGHRVGLYTSPHLVSLCERLVVDGRDIEPDLLAERVHEVRGIAETFPDDDRPTFFEVVTACAFRHFSLQGVEVAVLEVGLGGRLDATNVVDPLVSVLTHLAIDHTRFLGSSLEEIAREKAGIVKPGRPVVANWNGGVAASVLEARCAELEAPLRLSGRDFQCTSGEPGEDGTATVSYRGPAWDLGQIPLPLAGAHQVENGGLALAALEWLDALTDGVPVPLDAVRQGFGYCRWPGRLERLAGTDPELVLDGAHNEGATTVLAEAMAELFVGRPLVLLLGLSADKDHGRLLAPLGRIADRVVASSFGGPRALPAVDLARAAQRHFASVEEVGDLELALARARELAGPGGVVLATGSLFLVGRLRAMLVGGERSFRFD